MKKLIVVAALAIIGLGRCGSGVDGKGGPPDQLSDLTNQERSCLNGVVRGAGGDLKTGGIVIGMKMRGCTPAMTKIERYLGAY